MDLKARTATASALAIAYIFNPQSHANAQDVSAEITQRLELGLDAEISVSPRTQRLLNRKINRIDQILTRNFDVLDSNSKEWQEVIRDLKRDLPREARSLIRDDLDYFQQSVIASTQTGVMCLSDFAGDRLKQQINKFTGFFRNLARTGKATKSYLPPVVCNTTPKTINLDAPPETRLGVDFNGYDLNKNPNISLVLTTKSEIDGSFKNTIIDESFWDASTRYRIFLNTSQNGFILPQNSFKISLRVGDQECLESLEGDTCFHDYSIPVVATPPDYCRIVSETHVPTGTFLFDAVEGHKDRGDKEFNGAPVKVMFENVALYKNSIIDGGRNKDEIRLKGDIYFDEIRPGVPNNEHTIFNADNMSFQVKVLEPGWVLESIDSIQTAEDYERELPADNQTIHTFNFSNGGLYSRLQIHGDTGEKDDLNNGSWIQVRLNNIQYTKRQVDDCIPAPANTNEEAPSP